MRPDSSLAQQMPQHADAELLLQVQTLNRRGLEVICDMTKLGPSPGVEEWQSLDIPALQRVADAPYLLFEIDVDTALRSETRSMPSTLPTIVVPAIADAAPPYSIWGAGAGRLFAAATLQFAWHVTRTRPAAAPLTLGLDVDACEALRGGEFGRLDWSAEQSTRWLTLRWGADRAFWAQRLRAAAAKDAKLLRTNTLAGLQRLAGSGLRR